MKDKIIEDGIEYQKVEGDCVDCSLGKLNDHYLNINQNTCFFKYNCDLVHCYKRKKELRKEKLLKIKKPTKKLVGFYIKTNY